MPLKSCVARPKHFQGLQIHDDPSNLIDVTSFPQRLHPLHRPVMKSSARLPRYLWLHNLLLHDLSQQKYPVGHSFPTEAQLVQQYQVSRQTVREAMRLLADQGLIRRRRRLGTHVIATVPRNQTIDTVQCQHSHSQHSHGVRLSILGQTWKCLDEATAQLLNTNPTHWLHVYCQKHRINSAQQNALCVLYLRDECTAIVNYLESGCPHLPDLHQSVYGQSIQRVVQKVRAETYPPKQFPELFLNLREQPQTLTPALQVTYCHFDGQARIMSAITHCYRPHYHELTTCWHLEPDP